MYWSLNPQPLINISFIVYLNKYVKLNIMVVVETYASYLEDLSQIGDWLSGWSSSCLFLVVVVVVVVAVAVAAAAAVVVYAKL
jgi:hypothetical protein